MLILPSVFFQKTPLGKLGIAERAGFISNLYFPNANIADGLIIAQTPLIAQAFCQLDAYFAGELKTFSLPLAPHGTVFMQAVWQRLLTVPYGTTASYKDIAHAIGNPKTVRAVGLANHKNPIPIFIPCHRVIGSNGQLVGYNGGLATKAFLLNLESKHR